MRGMNQVFLIGNLGADPELRYTQGGTGVVNFNVAINTRKPDGDDKWVDHVEWVKCVVWGAQAEAMAQHLKKGAPVSVRGSLQTRKWVKESDNSDQYTTEVQCHDLIFLGTKEKGNSPAGDNVAPPPKNGGKPPAKVPPKNAPKGGNRR
jgi:single-strand DNA-binding protein